MNWFLKLLGREKRRSKRHLAPPLIAFYWDGGRSTAHAVPDISREGVFVSTDDRWFPDTVIRLTLQRNAENPQEQESDESITVHCRVVRTEVDGIGMVMMLASENKSESPAGPGAPATRRQWNQFMKRILADAKESPTPKSPYLSLTGLAPITTPANPDDPTAEHDPEENK